MESCLGSGRHLLGPFGQTMAAPQSYHSVGGADVQSLVHMPACLSAMADTIRDNLRRVGSPRTGRAEEGMRRVGITVDENHGPNEERRSEHLTPRSLARLAKLLNPDGF